MLCPSCGSKLNDGDRKCNACGTLMVQGPKVRNESAHSSAPINTMFKEAPDINAVYGQTLSKEAAKRVAEEEAARRAAEEAAKKAAAKRAAEEAAAKRAVEEAAKKAAAKRAAEEAAAKKAAEEAAKKAAAKRAAEEAAAKRAAEEAAKKAAAEAAKKAAAEAAAKRAAEEAARKAAAEAAAKRAVEEAARKAAAEAVAKRALEEAASKRAAEEAAAIDVALEAAIKAAKEASAKRAAEEAADKKAAEEATEKKAAEEAAEKKAAEEMAAKKAAEEAAVRRAAEEAASVKSAEKAEAKSVSPPPRLSYKIIGGNFPSVSITLDEGQSIFTQSDVMVWMSSSITLDTNTKRSGLSFIATYTSGSYGQEIGIASRFPGEIQALNIGGSAVIVQRKAFLAAQPNIILSAHVSMQLGDGHAASIVFQRLSGAGMAFVAIGGSLIERILGPGESIKADTANIAAFEESVSFQTQILSDFKNTVFGEGLILSTLTGPGKVWLQTLPLQT